MINLLTFHHSRHRPFSDSCESLKKAIDAFVDHKKVEQFYDHFQTNYGISADAIRLATKSCLERQYHYRKCSFKVPLFPRAVVVSLVKMIVFFFAVLLWSEKKREREAPAGLMVEGMETALNIKRFLDVIKRFGSEKTVVVGLRNMESFGTRFVVRPYFKAYLREAVLRALRIEFKKGIWLYLLLSWRMGINMLFVAYEHLNQMLYYESLFAKHPARVCIQERFYQTNAIRNDVFKKSGGKYVACIQKNMIPLGRTGFYCDIDVLFSLGKRTADRALVLGGRITEVVPVGSLFMEPYLAERKQPKNSDERYDIVYFGSNVSKGFHYLDVYDEFMSDYYQTFHWMVQLNRGFPDLRLAIKHHPSALIDAREQDILAGTSIETLNPMLNSYEIGFRSRLSVSYGSTMTFEMLGSGRHALFLDPSGRSCLLPERNQIPILDNIRMESYKELKERIADILENQKKFSFESKDVDQLCLESSCVSKRITDWLISIRDIPGNIDLREEELGKFSVGRQTCESH